MTTTSETTPAPRRGTLIGARVREAGWGYAFVLVPLAIFGAFFIYPFAYAVYISFFEWGILGKVESVGMQNYRDLFDDPTFHKAVKNTVQYAVFVVPLEMALGLLMALVINHKIRGRAFFRSAFYFPSIASSAAITAIAIFVLNANGLLNEIIGGNRSWFGDPSTALWAITGLNAWTTAGTVMLFYLAALQSIPTDVYEAAALDGTSTWRAFWRITFPLLKPAHFFVLVVFGIGALKIFDQAFIVSNGSGGPNYSTLTAVLYLYRTAIADIRFGYAAAIGVALFVLIFAITLLQRLIFGRPETA